MWTLGYCTCRYFIVYRMLFDLRYNRILFYFVMKTWIDYDCTGALVNCNKLRRLFGPGCVSESCAARSLLFISVPPHFYFVPVRVGLFVFGIWGYINVFFFSIRETVAGSPSNFGMESELACLLVFYFQISQTKVDDWLYCREVVITDASGPNCPTLTKQLELHFYWSLALGL